MGVPAELIHNNEGDYFSAEFPDFHITEPWLRRLRTPMSKAPSTSHASCCLILTPPAWAGF